MLLSITTTHHPATDLGFLLHKHPDSFKSIDLSVGKAHVFYSEATESRTTMCLVLDIDPIDIARGSLRGVRDDFALGRFVNDRPYVSSSLMSVAIAKAFSSALNGKCAGKPELVDLLLDFEVEITALAAPRGGEDMIRKFFEPLGYLVEVQGRELDATFPEWGLSKYYNVTLKNKLRLQELLSHLYVLIPALDTMKHYYVDNAEIEKLLSKGKGWLKSHPMHETIVKRYLFDLEALSNKALVALRNVDIDEVVEAVEETNIGPQDLPAEVAKRKRLHDRRLEAVAAELVITGAERVLDLGCGEAKLIRQLLPHRQFKNIVGMDVSYAQLLRAKERLHYENMAPAQKARVSLIHGSLTYRDSRLSGFDAAAVVEVIEHLDLNRLRAFERVLFEFARPKVVVLTTPNKEYNVQFEGLAENQFRHSDHRFEWTRSEFETWAGLICAAHNYKVEFRAVGDEVEGIGAQSQMAIFIDGH